MDIVARAKGLLLQPESEWRVIAAEPTDIPRIFTGYVMILSAIPAIAGLIGTFLLVGGIVSVPSLLIATVVGYILGLVGIFVLGKIIEFLAPKFGGPQDGIAAMKLAGFAPTASWVAGIALLLPMVGTIFALIGGLYSIYLFYVGAPIVMGIPQDKVIPFTVSVFVVAILVNLVIGAAVGVLR
ncbi:MAG: yip1 domain protein [Rubritepida sp.]|nr:yip1 domain protein [Rubritepida sp.]